ncbi:hypothetical protein E2562_006998 [Oryza meyeriana var. granulata]|uniref:Uncharacterized protein n=1 Tax=Oryza meyeriana var. granulata TaxID=110450 RepID=A0A6G1E8K4_9ORYZ|nr:hypothetical protein E2562_006998 [Oryza meyeriana var. granulata]
MKSNAELASFGATPAFAIEGALVLGPASSRWPATSRLECAMLAALVSMAMILAVKFLQWWFMLSLLPKAIAVALNVATMA